MRDASIKLAALMMSAILLMSVAGVMSAQQQQPAVNISDGADAAVSFSDQTTDGTTVTVDAVNTTDGGFVVIHDSRLPEGEVIDSIIGVSEYLEPGLHENVTVTLFEGVPGAEFNRTELTEDETLIAMPHRDTNGNETYDFITTEEPEDGPYLDNETAVTDSANVNVVEPTVTGESFTVSNLTAPDVVEQGDVVNVSATITNPNDEADTQTVDFRFRGELLVSEEVSLNATESTEFTVTLDSSEVETGPAIHGVYTRDRGVPAQILIVDEIQSFEISGLDAPESVAPGDEISVNATVTNPNEFAIDQPVEYRFDGDRIETRNVAIEGEESVTVEFRLDTEGITPGTYIHSAFSNEFGQDAFITVDEPAEDGEDGMDGEDGEDGEDGMDGEDGEDGEEETTETSEE